MADKLNFGCRIAEHAPEIELSNKVRIIIRFAVLYCTKNIQERRF